MIWKLVNNDGKVFEEYSNGIGSDLTLIDKSNMKTFGIYDTNSHLVQFDGASGRMDLQNLNLEKLNQLAGGEKIELNYDSEAQAFKMTPESMKLYHSLLLETDKYNFIEFDQTGVLNINGQPFFIGMEISGEFVPFKDQPPYNDIIHYKDAVTDFIGSKNSFTPYKRVDAILSNTIGYNKVHTYKDYEFKISVKVIYSTVQKCINLKYLLSCNKTVSGTLIMFYDNQKSEAQISMDANETCKWERVLTVI